MTHRCLGIQEGDERLPGGPAVFVSSHLIQASKISREFSHGEVQNHLEPLQFLFQFAVIPEGLHAQVRARVVDLLRAEAALHLPLDADGALTGSKVKKGHVR